MKKLAVYLTLCLSVFAAEKITIQEAAEMALKNNRDIKIEMKNLENSDLDVRKSWKESFFKVNFVSNELFFTSEGSNLDLPNGKHGQAISLEQPIFQGGKISTGIKTAKTAKNLSMYELEKAKKDTVLDVIDMYIVVLNYENKTEVLQSSEKSLNENLRTIKEKYNVRMATKPDLLEAQRALLEVQSQILDNQNKVDTAKDNLVKALGLRVGSDIEVVPFTVAEKFSSKIDISRDTLRLEDENTEYKISELQSEISKLDIDNAKSIYYPMVNANLTYGTDSQPEFSDSFDGKNAFMSVGVTFKWQLFDWGSAKDDVKKAKNNLEISKLRQTSTLENVRTALRSNYLDIVHSEKVLETKRLAVETAAEVYKLETERYRYNLITLRDLLNAEVKLRESKIDYISTRLNYYYLISKYESMFN
jgi:outer membrane protein